MSMIHSLREDIHYRVEMWLREFHRLDFGPDPEIAVLRKCKERADTITDRIMVDVQNHLTEVSK